MRLPSKPRMALAFCPTSFRAFQTRFGLHSPSPYPRGKSGAPLRFPNSRILVRPIFYCLHSSRNATNYSKTAALESSAATNAAASPADWVTQLHSGFGHSNTTTAVLSEPAWKRASAYVANGKRHLASGRGRGTRPKSERRATARLRFAADAPRRERD